MRLKSIITVIALILIMFMSAIESSIISLALPTIKQDLNAGNLISLIFTAYFIALVIANPIVGELLSRFKIIYVAIAGLLLFMKRKPYAMRMVQKRFYHCHKKCI
ncbi:MFS transporter, partial [Staphylococcus aureus]|nr:MFS transporter [Staphylococcus aureus]MDG6513898.1 MFS transporter [Staphylococcus aureus]MDG6516278.1 MFS transporter [Staphylococcus aureus]MDG6518898.1 MFS transporter [Staphylococcus aureus]MDG6521632.1 MFS transporter [Staphylococcus aureus]